MTELNNFSESFNKEQKEVMIATMTIIANADGKISSNEENQIRTSAALLGINLADLVKNIPVHNLQSIIIKLKTLDKNQKEWLAVALDELLQSVPKLSMIKLQYVMGILDDIGISEKEYTDILNKADSLRKKFIS